MRASPLFALVFALTLLPSVPAQTTQIAVEVVDEATDSVGQRLVYYVREGFRRSAAFRLTEAKEARWKIIVSTMPRFDDSPSTATMYAIIWTIAAPSVDGSETSYYVGNTIGYAGTDVVTRSADGVVASTDRMTTEIRRVLAGIRRQ